MLCGKTARVVVESGVITVECTLESHEGLTHYDGAFRQGWTEYVDQADL